MIVINELRISDDNRNLIVDASVDNLCYYNDVGIASVIIDTQHTYSNSHPSNRAVYHVSVEDLPDNPENCQGVFVEKKEDKIKRIRLVLDKGDLGTGLSDNLFFVYIVANGIPSPSTPCGYDNTYVMGIVWNKRLLYNIGMSYVREMGDTCTVPRGFIDYILRFNAFQLALETGNYPVAIDYWNKFFLRKGNSIKVPNNKRCGCHGFY